jgi:hypothetical protein
MSREQFVEVMQKALRAAPGSGNERDAIITAIDAACEMMGWDQAYCRVAVLDIEL